MDIKPLLELVSASLACKLRGTTQKILEKNLELPNLMRQKNQN